MIGYLSNLKLEIVDSICFFFKANKVIVSVHSVLGYQQIDLLDMNTYQQEVESLLNNHAEVWNKNNKSFNPNVTLPTVLINSDSVIALAGRNLVFTHVKNERGFIAAISKTANEEETKEDYVRPKPELAEAIKQSKNIVGSDSGEIRELSEDAAVAHRRYQMLMGQYEPLLSESEYFEYEIRRDPIGNFFDYGIHGKWVHINQYSMS